MSNYKGLFTFDIDNHRYVSVEQADGIISNMNYQPEGKEDPKEYWFVDDIGGVDAIEEDGSEETEDAKQIGNYFETKEEAELAVEKLKAWKRLKDNGFKFDRWFTRVEGGIQVNLKFPAYNGISLEDKADLDLLFGGKG